jgi:hypothetical protein
MCRGVDSLWRYSESVGESAIYPGPLKAVDRARIGRRAPGLRGFDSSVLHPPDPLCKVNSLQRSRREVVHQRLSVMCLAYGDRAVFTRNHKQEQAPFPGGRSPMRT